MSLLPHVELAYSGLHQICKPKKPVMIHWLTQLTVDSEVYDRIAALGSTDFSLLKRWDIANRAQHWLTTASHCPIVYVNKIPSIRSQCLLCWNILMLITKMYLKLLLNTLRLEQNRYVEYCFQWISKASSDGLASRKRLAIIWPLMLTTISDAEWH